MSSVHSEAPCSIDLAAYCVTSRLYMGRKKALVATPAPHQKYLVGEICLSAAENLDFMRVSGSVVMNTHTTKSYSNRVALAETMLYRLNTVRR